MAHDKKKEEEQQEQAHTNASTGEVVHNTSPGEEKIPKMAIKVYAPFQVYFEGEALSLTAVN